MIGVDLGASQMVTDAGLKELKNFKKLQALYLRDTKVTDAGIESRHALLPSVSLIHWRKIMPEAMHEYGM